jgi:phosphonate transport system permease protein
LLAVGTILATVIWSGRWGWLAVPAAMWLWNIWDAVRLPKGSPIIIAALLWLAAAYGIGWQVTEIRPLALFQNQERAATILGPMLRPDFIQQRAEALIGFADLQVPCSAEPPAAERTENGVTVKITPSCARVEEMVFVNVEGLWVDQPVTLYWMTPIGSIAKQYAMQADAEGKVSYAFTVPPEALAAAPDPDKPLMHTLRFVQNRQIGGMQISKNGKYVLQGIYETLALALLATTLGAILALPLGFLAARNLMGGNPLTLVIYTVVRTILNIVRSIESLIIAIVFVIIVGLGPFPGMLAITIHTVAALGKLYSEVIEGIDPGPIEAIRATGADWLETVRYAVIPQIVPPFTALTIYRWDINVRSSTIIGFVGGGGIGFFLYQWILIGDYRAVSSSFIAIGVVVVILDFFSARLRERLR